MRIGCAPARFRQWFPLMSAVGLLFALVPRLAVPLDPSSPGCHEPIAAHVEGHRCTPRVRNRRGAPRVESMGVGLASA